jgi:hypothetical protein
MDLSVIGCYFQRCNIKVGELFLTLEDFEKVLFFVKPEPAMNQLDKVVIMRSDNISAVSLGIISSNQQSYTVAERKYATASSGRMNPMGFDPLLNYLSGRTAMLKKELKVEKKEFDMKAIEAMFNRSHFVGKLKIPFKYVEGFKYYVVDNKEFMVILESKNKGTVEFF